MDPFTEPLTQYLQYTIILGVFLAALVLIAILASSRTPLDLLGAFGLILLGIFAAIGGLRRALQLSAAGSQGVSNDGYATILLVFSIILMITGIAIVGRKVIRRL